MSQAKMANFRNIAQMPCSSTRTGRFCNAFENEGVQFWAKNGVQNGGHPRPGRPEGVQKWGRVGVRATFGGPKFGPKRGSKLKWAIFLNIEN